MPFQNTCSMNDSPLPSGWLGRGFQIHRKCTSCFSFRCGDAYVSECQDDTLPSQLQLTHHYDTEQNESDLDIHMLLPSSSMTSHSCKPPVPVSRAGHFAPYCLWIAKQEQHGRVQRAWQAMSSDPKPDCQILSPHLIKGGTLNKLLQFLASISTSVKQI